MDGCFGGGRTGRVFKLENDELTEFFQTDLKKVSDIINLKDGSNVISIDDRIYYVEKDPEEIDPDESTEEA